MATDSEDTLATYEELTAWECDFEDARLDLLRQQETVLSPLFAKRQAIIAKIPAFWSLVFEQSPPEFEPFIQPSDSQLFADCLKSLDVTRFEINDPNGSPRSVNIKFEFSPNKYFEDTILEKKFWYRRSSDGWAGFVSEPIKIQWKKGEDLTKGLTDAVYALWEANGKNGGWDEGPDSKLSSKQEYKALEKTIQESEEESLSLFAWFSFISEYRYVGAEESAKANVEEKERRQKLKEGKQSETNDDDDDDEITDYLESKIFQGGDDFTNLLVDEIWTSAFDYFTGSLEDDDDEDDEVLSDLDMEVDDDSDDEVVDIRALVGKGKKDKESPPAKKRKT